MNNGFYLTEEEGKLLTLLLGDMCEQDIDDIFRIDRIKKADPNDAWYAMGMLLGGYEKTLDNVKKIHKLHIDLFHRLHEKYGSQK